MATFKNLVALGLAFGLFAFFCVEAASDLAAWGLVFATYLIGFIPALWPASANRRQLSGAYFAILTIHHIVAMISNEQLLTALGDSDSAAFHAEAMRLSWQNVFPPGIDAFLYRQVLAGFYLVFGPSRFLGNEFSVLATSLSMVVFARLLGAVKYQGNYAFALLLVFLTPGNLWFTSITLREAYELLFFLSLIHAGFRFRQTWQWPYAVWMLLATLVLSRFHRGLVAFAWSLPFILLFWPMDTWRLRWSRQQIFGFFIGFAVLGAVIVIAISAQSFWEGNLVLNALRSHNVFNLIETLRSANSSSRTNFGIQVDFSNTESMTFSIFAIVINYLLAPFPWQVSANFDLIPMLESFGRFIVLIFALWGCLTSRGRERQCSLMLFTIYLALACIFAAGTTNFGTSWRHNTLHYWLLVVIGGPYLEAALVSTVGAPHQKKAVACSQG